MPASGTWILPPRRKCRASRTFSHTRTRQNRRARLRPELSLQGEVVAIVAAETEDQAEDAAAAIQVEYDVHPFASTLKDAMAPDAPDLRGGKGNLLRHPSSPAKFPNATWAQEQGAVDQGFADAD